MDTYHNKTAEPQIKNLKKILKSAREKQNDE